MRDARHDSPYWSLRLLFGLVPIVAGFDKFFDLIVYWPKYISPFALEVLPVDAQTFMFGVGIIEIVAGLLVLSPLVRVGAYIVSAWLVAIAVNLVMGGWYDIAIRDVGLAVAAFALGQLAAVREEGVVPVRRRAGLEPAAATP